MNRLSLFALLALILSACTQDTTSDLQPLDGETIYASIDVEESRIQLNGQQKTVWNANDQIVVHAPTEASLWTFTGKTGDRDGSFKRAGTFRFDNFSKYGFKKYYALYPYDNWEGVGTFSDGSPAVFFTLPAEQDYVKDSYGVHANLMFATSDNGQKYSFKNMMGYIRLSMTGEKCISAIELQGSSGEIVAGDMYISPDYPFNPSWYDNFSRSIIINCGSGVQLSSKPTNFYFSLPPMIFESGLIINIYYTDGSIYTKNTGKSITIECNTIQPFAEFVAKGENEWQIVEIHHTASEFIAPVVTGPAAIGNINWGDDSVNIFNEITKHYYTDGKESHTITIQALNANQVELNSCEGVTKIDLSKF